MAQVGDVQFGNSSSDNFDLNRAGTGGSDLPNLKAEFNDIPHVKGILSMARSSDPNSANSQFFICLEDAPHLDRQYTVFGRVVEGMEWTDVMHFVFNAGLAIGITPKEFYNYYLSKNEENWNRQKRGY